MKKFNRFKPPEVAQATKELEVAKEKLQAAAETAYMELLGSFSALYLPFRSAATALASLDALQSLALVATYSGCLLVSSLPPPPLGVCKQKRTSRVIEAMQP